MTETPSDLYSSNVTLYATTLNFMRLKLTDIKLHTSLPNCVSKILVLLYPSEPTNQLPHTQKSGGIVALPGYQGEKKMQEFRKVVGNMVMVIITPGEWSKLAIVDHLVYIRDVPIFGNYFKFQSCKM